MRSLENHETTYLCHQNNDDNTDTNPGSDDTTGSLEGDLVQSVSLGQPSLAEANMSITDGSPSKEGCETGQSRQPAEDNITSAYKVDVGKGTPGENEKDRWERATGLVDHGEDLGSVALLSKGSESSGTSINARDTDGQDRHQNNQVHEMVETLETSVFTSQDERGGVSTLARQQVIVVGVNQKTNKEETENVEESDTPEDLLDGAGEGLDGVLGLGSGETDQLSSGERESSRDEDRAETLEAILESSRVVPVSGTPVLVVAAALGTTAKNKDESNDHEDACGNQLESGSPELFFSISDRTENVDDHDEDEEDGNPYRYGYVLIPVLNCETAYGEFERQDDDPREHIIPAHGETPRGVDEARRVSVKTSRDRVHNSEFTKSIDCKPLARCN